MATNAHAQVMRPEPPLDRRSSYRTTLNPILRVLPVAIVVYSFLLLPIEVKLTIAGLNIYSYRIALFIAVPLAIYLMPRREVRFSLLDIPVAIGSLWILISFVHHLGASSGLVRAFAIFLDTFGAYLVARLSISNPADLRRTLIVILPGLLFASGFLLIESVSGRLLVRPFFGSIFGQAVSYSEGEAAGSLQLVKERRLGLLRAYSTFSYPILGGAILASLLPLYLLSGLRSWMPVLGVAACVGAFFSVSSAALAGLALAIGLVVLDRVLPRLRPFSWPIIAALVAVYAVLANVGLQGGVAGLIGRFTLNPATAYIRRMQWKYGGDAALENPIFGLGFAEYARPSWLTSAIDAHFLHLAMRSGLLTSLCFLIVTVLVLFLIGRAVRTLPKMDRDLLIGVNFMLIVLLFTSMTVSFFSEANVFFMIALAVGVSCTSFAPPARQGPMPSPARVARHRRDVARVRPG